jgi:FkbM family methyltransferase
MKAKSFSQWLNNMHELLRIASFSVLNNHKYGKDSIMWPFVNFWQLFYLFRHGKRDVAGFEVIKNLYGFGSEMGGTDSLVFNDIRIPLPLENEGDISVFLLEMQDLIIPYLINDKKILNGIVVEGPYEINENVCLQSGDVVIDCGANMGLFSAIASAKGCISYAFEPVKDNIDKFLSKTAKWNKNINIVNYALADKTRELFFTIGSRNNCGFIEELDESDYVKTNRNTTNIKVNAITLDEWVKQNSIEKVDFIKADIEGAERQLLKGAKETLKKCAPKLSICKYHLPDDPKVLKSLILEANPNYKILEKYKKIYAWVE